MEPPVIQPNSLTPLQDDLPGRFGQVRFDSGPVDLRASKASLASSKSAMSWSTSDTPVTRQSSTFSYNSENTNGSTWSAVSKPITNSQRSSLLPSRRPSMQPLGPRPIDRLPQEVLDCVIDQLRRLHWDPLLASCATCYLRDLHSMCMVNKTWRRAARPKMYRSIWLVGNDSIVHVRKRFKMKQGARLKLLRRTLRENRMLAQLVRELKVPAMLNPQSSKSSERRQYVDLVASVVMSCPNLERLAGFYNRYDHNFDRLTHALSTRPKLKEHIWVVAGDNSERKHFGHYLMPGLLQPEQADTFLHLHDMWTRLETLFIHSQSTGVLDHEVFIGAFTRLPSLKNLSVSNFDVDDFYDATLQALPALECLRLQDLPGLTDRGILEFSSSRAARSLRCLALINLEIMGLAVFAKLFASLRDLRRFTLVQESSPELPIGGIVFQPIIASASLEYLHWDILIPGTANENLASSIRAEGFPRLRVLRAPSDHHGLLQDVCRPKEQVSLSSDKYSFAARNAAARENRTRYLRTLFAARQAAQQRIEQARTHVRFRVMIEEDGLIKQVFNIPDFVGAIGSNITYSLTPDVHGSDSAVIDMADLIDGSRELDARDGCTGVWNSEHPGGKKWWSHVERYRYRRIDLARFF